MDLVGGDTTSSKSGLMLSVTAIGEAAPDKVVEAAAPRPGTCLWSAVNSEVLTWGCRSSSARSSSSKRHPGAQPDLTGHEEFLERQLKPEARTDVVDELAKLEVVPTAMIDISDGLASEALHIAAQSGCGVKLYEDKIPMSEKMYDTARAFHLDPTMCALSGGEDYELLFTVPQERFEDIQNHPMFSIIGHLTEDAGERTLVTRNGMEAELKAQGWDGLQGGLLTPAPRSHISRSLFRIGSKWRRYLCTPSPERGILPVT